jgi:hypothetical protein
MHMRDKTVRFKDLPPGVTFETAGEPSWLWIKTKPDSAYGDFNCLILSAPNSRGDMDFKPDKYSEEGLVRVVPSVRIMSAPPPVPQWSVTVARFSNIT